jgi:restriction system protein
VAVYVDRAGKHGEHQDRFLSTGCIYLTWEILQNQDLAGFDFPRVRAALETALPQASTAKISNHASQVFTFISKMKPGDLVVTPLFQRAAVAIGEIIGAYRFDPAGSFMYRHSRTVRWLTTELSRARLDSNLRQALCAMQTIFPVNASDAERRLRSLASGSPPLVETREVSNTSPTTRIEATAEVGPQQDLERRGYDDIGDLILRKLKGRGLERLIEGILLAQGYHTYRSPEGPDKGVDLFAALGPLGFGSPRICVQVKCTESPIDHPTLSQLLGTMQSMKAQQGLLVSWGGFKSSVEKVRADHFFAVRLWDQNDVIRELLANYDKLSEDLKAELPLKRIWIVNVPDED